MTNLTYLEPYINKKKIWNCIYHVEHTYRTVLNYPYLNLSKLKMPCTVFLVRIRRKIEQTLGYIGCPKIRKQYFTCMF